MAKWFGKIGYAVTSETDPGLWETTITTKSYYGELTTDRRKRQDASRVNDDLNLSNVLSIIADPFAIENCSNMAYAEIMGAKWKITDIEVLFPRLILTIGGLWNENAAGTTESP